MEPHEDRRYLDQLLVAARVVQEGHRCRCARAADAGERRGLRWLVRLGLVQRRLVHARTCEAHAESARLARLLEGWIRSMQRSSGRCGSDDFAYLNGLTEALEKAQERSIAVYEQAERDQRDWTDRD